MKVFITGGTGFVGKALTERLIEEGYEITVLTRKETGKQHPTETLSFIEGNPTERGDWQKRLNNYDVIINLAGSGIFRRWNKKNKKAIRDSRILTTKNIVEGLTGNSNREILLISTSAVGYYGYHGDEILTEENPPGNDFLATISAEWENIAMEAGKSNARIVICRFGVVLGKDGGALKKMILPYKYYMGSPIGSGRQYFSWIHITDLVDIYAFLIKDSNISGPVNCTAPEPVRNIDLTKILGRVLKRPVFMPHIPDFMIRISMGEFGNTILKGQRVVPKRLLEMRFNFKFRDLTGALEDILWGEQT